MLKNKRFCVYTIPIFWFVDFKTFRKRNVYNLILTTKGDLQ